MRPTFGYLMALTWAAQMLGVACVSIFNTQRFALVLKAMASLSAIWGIGLSVLGIYVYKRSEDKKLINSSGIIHWSTLSLSKKIENLWLCLFSAHQNTVYSLSKL